MGTDYLYAMGRVMTGVSGIKRVHVGEGNTDWNVAPLPSSLPNTPAAVVLDGEQPVIAASWERHTVTPEVAVYVAREANVGQAYELVRSFRFPIIAAFREKGTLHGTAASCVVLRCDAVEDREWPVGSGKWYLVQPVTFEVKFNLPVAYIPGPSS